MNVLPAYGKVILFVCDTGSNKNMHEKQNVLTSFK